eukprot:2553892-Prymnesium_polylepis.1
MHSKRCPALALLGPSHAALHATPLFFLSRLALAAHMRSPPHLYQPPHDSHDDSPTFSFGCRLFAPFGSVCVSLSLYCISLPRKYGRVPSCRLLQPDADSESPHHRLKRIRSMQLGTQPRR